MAVSYQPIEGCDWTAVCLAPYDDFYHGITVLMYAMIGIAIAAFITACVVGLVVVKLSIKPLKSVSDAKSTRPARRSTPFPVRSRNQSSTSAPRLTSSRCKGRRKLNRSK